jgi:hypothetical protein
VDGGQRTGSFVRTRDIIPLAGLPLFSADFAETFRENDYIGKNGIPLSSFSWKSQYHEHIRVFKFSNVFF